MNYESRSSPHVESQFVPPEVRTSPPFGRTLVLNKMQIDFDIEDFKLKQDIYNECWSIWPRARPWLESHGYYLYEETYPAHPQPPPSDACTANQHPYATYPAASSLEAFSRVCEYCLRPVVSFTVFARPRWCSLRTRAGAMLCSNFAKPDQWSPAFTRCLRATSPFWTFTTSLAFFLHSGFCNGTVITVSSYYHGMSCFVHFRNELLLTRTGGKIKGKIYRGSRPSPRFLNLCAII
jgi:hypothetical protein